MTLPAKERLWEFGPLVDVKMGPSPLTGLVREMVLYTKLQLSYPINRIEMLFTVAKACRVVVVERTDGRHCWLSLGKKQPLNVGASGHMMFSEACRRPTICGDRPYIVRPALDAVVTCLSCLANGLPSHLQ